ACRRTSPSTTPPSKWSRWGTPTTRTPAAPEPLLPERSAPPQQRTHRKGSHNGTLGQGQPEQPGSAAAHTPDFEDLVFPGGRSTACGPDRHHSGQPGHSPGIVPSQPEAARL